MTQRKTPESSFRLISEPPLPDTRGYEVYSSSKTFGRPVVDHEDRMATLLLETDLFEDELDRYTSAEERVNGKLTPRDGMIRYRLGKLAGKSADMDDYRIVNNVFRPPDMIKKALQDRTLDFDATHVTKLDELDKIRSHISDLTESEREALDAYMTSSASEFLMSAKDKRTGNEETQWAEWLAHRAGNEELTNVLQWHAFRVGEQVVDYEVTQRIIDKKMQFKDNVSEFVELKLLTPDVLEKLHKVDETEVFIGDAFDTVIKGRSGYHRQGTKSVVIAQGMGKTPQQQQASLLQNIDETMDHELIHAVVAGENTLGDDRMGARWLNEAMTQRLDVYMKLNSKDVVHNGTTPYLAENTLFETVLAGREAGAQVDTKLATRAYSGGGREYQEFATAVDQLWQEDNVIEKVSEAVLDYERNFAEGSPITREIRQKALRVVINQLGIAPRIIFEKTYV